MSHMKSKPASKALISLPSRESNQNLSLKKIMPIASL